MCLASGRVSLMPEQDESLTRAAYDKVADVYAEHITGTDSEEPLELAMIDHFITLVPPPRRVLDAGCGAGRMLPQLAERGCQPEGVDLSPQMVRRARADHPGHPVTVASLTDLPHTDGVFDGVFSWYSTIHNPDADLDRMLTEMTRVLRPGGALLLGFQAGDGMRRVGRGYAALGYDVVMHRYHRSPQDVATRLEDLGLTVVAQLERAPAGTEDDPQAVVTAQKPAA